MVTHTGRTYYCTANSPKERDDWILHVRTALECSFGNPKIIHFKPSKIIMSPPEPTQLLKCAKTSIVLTKSSAIACKSCGRRFCSEYVQETSPVLQIGIEESIKQCSDCKHTQMILLWFKCTNYYNALSLHEQTPEVLYDIGRFKNSFKLRKESSGRLQMAAELLDQNLIKKDEFEELRRVDHEFTRSTLFENALKLSEAMDHLDNDMQTIIGWLMTAASSDSENIVSFQRIAFKCITIADEHPRIFEFYLPQILQIHNILTRNRSSLVVLGKVDCLQQVILAIAARYPTIALKCIWSLTAITTVDYQTKKVNQAQYAACMCLLIQIEIVCMGTCSSLLKKIEGLNNENSRISSSLSRLLTLNEHQSKELISELNILFRVRHQLLIVYEREKLWGASICKKVKPNTYENHMAVSKEAKDVQESLVGNVESNGNNSSSSSSEEGKSNGDGKVKFHHLPVANADEEIIVLCHDRSLTLKVPISSCLYTLFAMGTVDENGYLTVFLEFYNEMPMIALKEFPRNILGFEIRQLSSSEEANIGENAGSDKNEGNIRSDESLVNDSTKEEMKGDDDNLSGSSNGANNGNVSRSMNMMEKENSTNTCLDSSMESMISSHIVSAFTCVCRGLLLSRQLNLVESITSMVDELRNVDRPLRTETLKSEMMELNDSLRSFRYYDPIEISGEPLYHMQEVIVEECRVFRTKARAPSMIVTKVERIDHDNFHDENMDDNLDDSALTVDISIHSKSSHGPASPLNLTRGSSAGINHFVKPLDEEEVDNILGSKMQHMIDDVHDMEKRRAASTDANDDSDVGGVFHPNQPPPPPPPTTTTTSSMNYATVSSTEATKMKRRPSSENLNKRDSPVSLLSSHRKSVPFLSILGIDPSDINKSKDNSSTPSSSSSTVSSTAFSSASNTQAISYSSALSDSTMKDLNAKLEIETNGNELEDLTNGEISSTVLLSAQRLLAAGDITESDYEKILQHDAKFRGERANEEALRAQKRVENCFGESWARKKLRILNLSNEENERHNYFDPSTWPKLDLRCFIVKSNDDLRQEVCCLQVMELCNEIFIDNGLSSQLYLKPYRIISTGADTGLVEVLPDTMSIDALKKTQGFSTLPKYFETVYGTTNERLRIAKKNFSSSLAAYSLFCYLLQIKDRHNGNILLSADGHIMHIDFGFLLSIAPGGMLSQETAPFKLTEEMVEVLDGLDSPMFSDFVKAFTTGFIALKAASENIISMVKILSVDSPFPCFAGKDTNLIMEKLKSRFRTDLNLSDTVQHCLDLIIESYGHQGSKRYDSFQWYTNGIVP